MKKYKTGSEFFNDDGTSDEEKYEVMQAILEAEEIMDEINRKKKKEQEETELEMER